MRETTHLADDVSEVDGLILALTSSGPQLPHRAMIGLLTSPWQLQPQGTWSLDRLPLVLDQVVVVVIGLVVLGSTSTGTCSGSS